MIAHTRMRLSLIVGACLAALPAAGQTSSTMQPCHGRVDLRGTAIAFNSSEPVRLESRLKAPERTGAPTEVGPPTMRAFAIDATALSAASGPFLPDDKSTSALKLRVTAELDSTFIEVRAYVGERTLCFGSATPASQQDVLVPAWFQGYVEITREDLGSDPATVFVALRTEAFERMKSDETKSAASGWFLGSTARGYSAVQGITSDGYAQLVAYGECDYLNATERDEGGCADLQLHDQRARRAPSRQIYAFVSEMIGRNSATEFGIADRYRPASHSEPMAVFFGLSGMNRILLLDCRSAHEASCGNGKLAEPWQTSLQQADYMWVVYIEDDQSPFDTSIDVEYRAHGPEFDYDEFDPRSQTSLGSAETVSVERELNQKEQNTARLSKVLRVGAKRLRVRDAPVQVLVGFTRRGPNYGVRQWRRAFTKTSAHWWALAGTAMVAGKPVKPRSVTFVPEPRNDLIAPDRGRLAQDEGETWVYAAVSFRLPGIRARALDQPGSMQRLAWNLIPDYSAGVAVRKGHFPVLASLSWPILVERLYFFWGASFVPQPRFFPGYGEGQLLPLTTNLNDVRRYVWEHEYVFGLSVDVIRSK